MNRPFVTCICALVALNLTLSAQAPPDAHGHDTEDEKEGDQAQSATREVHECPRLGA